MATQLGNNLIQGELSRKWHNFVVLLEKTRAIPLRMKQVSYILLLLSIFLLQSCGKKANIQQAIAPEMQSDSLFIEFVSSDDYSASVKKIDRLIKQNEYDLHHKALLYYEKGRNLGNLEKDAEAIGSLEKALTLFQKEDNKKYINRTNLLLGDSFSFLGKPKVALGHITLALEGSRALGEKKIEAKALNSWAYILYQKKDMMGAIRMTLDAAAIQKGLKDFDALSATYNNIGFVYEDVFDFRNARIYYEKAVKISLDHDRKSSLPLRNLGRFNFDQGALSMARENYQAALDVENKLGNTTYLKEIYDALLLIAIHKKDFDLSKSYIKKRDSVMAIQATGEKESKLALVRNAYELEAKKVQLDHEISLNNKNKAIFFGAFVLLFLLGLLFYQRARNTKLKLHQDKVELEQTVLRSQMNPHFIFNALSAIQNSLLDNNPIKTASYLSRFAKLIRQNFDFISESSILLADELDALKNYMETQQLRFADKFSYEINIAQDIDEYIVEIPPLLIQPFIENTIEHGFRNKKEKGKITINIFRNKNLICYEILDNGVGYSTAKKDNKIHAIDIFKKRLILLGEKDNTFTVDTSSNGTIVKFCLKRMS